jgi:hypothetical protein
VLDTDIGRREGVLKWLIFGWSRWEHIGTFGEKGHKRVRQKVFGPYDDVSVAIASPSGGDATARIFASF